MISGLTAFVASCLIVAGATEDETAKDLGRLQGTWVHESMQEDPKVKRPGRKLMKLEVQEGQVTIVFENFRTFKPIVHFDASKSPKQIDFTFDEGNRKDKVWQGIYQIDSDTLTLCFPVEPDGNNRPSEFTTPDNSGLRLVVLKREKPGRDARQGRGGSLGPGSLATSPRGHSRGPDSVPAASALACSADCHAAPTAGSASSTVAGTSRRSLSLTAQRISSAQSCRHHSGARTYPGTPAQRTGQNCGPCAVVQISSDDPCLPRKN